MNVLGVIFLKEKVVRRNMSQRGIYDYINEDEPDIEVGKAVRNATFHMIQSGLPEKRRQVYEVILANPRGITRKHVETRMNTCSFFISSGEHYKFSHSNTIPIPFSSTIVVSCSPTFPILSESSLLGCYLGDKVNISAYATGNIPNSNCQEWTYIFYRENIPSPPSEVYVPLGITIVNPKNMAKRSLTDKDNNNSILIGSIFHRSLPPSPPLSFSFLPWRSGENMTSSNLN